MKYYGQNLEDKIANQFFGDYVGTLLDLGSNDGVTLSNSRALILKGWSGLLVEASPMAYSRLQELYAGSNNVTTIPCAVASYNGEITLYESGEHLKKGDIGLLSSVKKSELARWGNTMEFQEATVPCLTFNSIMKLSPFNKFDFITIDLEGCELDILPQMDFDKLGTSLVCVEFNGKNEQRFKDIMQGFKLIHKNAENLIFSR